MPPALPGVSDAGMAAFSTSTMSFEPVRSVRFAVSDSPDGLVISLPAKANWFGVVFLCIWLGGWGVGEAAAIRQVFRGGPEDYVGFFLLFWLVGWTVGGCIVLYSLSWMLAGVERLRLVSDALVLRNEVFGLGFEKRFDLTAIRNIRVDATEAKRGSRIGALHIPGVGRSGAVLFDYGAKTIRFGTGVDEVEASQMIEVLKGRFRFA
jgi:hypothetical protein